ncbi:hypothetical protein, conserved [Leishmania tarentolae]|uniref:Uncharacterized protein n=1 Tax=Leishmania tarentolae TaxID=5689 RepID=A0A640KA63_LEITA|nr:hypothetical protein, conserved [Leishmania tarentolae]
MYRERLIAFYSSYNPACLESVDEILEIFEGREEELFTVLAEKYGVRRPLDDTGSKSSALVRCGEPAYCRRSSSALESDKLKDLRKSAPCDVCGCLREALRAKTEEVTQLMLKIRTIEGRVKKTDTVHTTVCAPEPSRGSNLELTCENGGLSEKLKSCENENANLNSRNRELRKICVVLEAENEALRRQKKMDEDTLDHLRERIREHEERERQLLESVAVRSLEAGSPLHENEFEEIIRQSQRHIEAFYEKKMCGMQAEMDQFYTHASACIQEKDTIIELLKKERM